MNPLYCLRLALVLCLLGSQTLLGDDGATRDWHDRSGFFSLTAEIVGVNRSGNGPRIELRKADGSLVEVPYALFSDEDQQHAVAWYRDHQSNAKDAATPKLPQLGDGVKIKYGSRWYKGEIVEVEGQRFRFRYHGYSATWDEWKTAEQIRWEDDSPVIPGGPSDPNAEESAAKLPRTDIVDVASDTNSHSSLSGDSRQGSATESTPAVRIAVTEPAAGEAMAEPPVPGERGLPMVGDRVQIKWGNSWWKGVIEEIDGERFRFDYDGWDSSPDEWRTADQLRWEDDTPVVPGGPADPGVPKPAQSVAKTPQPTATKSADSRVRPQPNVTSMDLSHLESSTETNSKFPPGLSPKETLAYLQQQATRGNLQVVWDWVPDDFRDYISSQQHRDALKVLDQVSAKGLGQAHFLKELVVVLRKHPTFVQNNPVVRMLLEDQPTVDALASVYEPGTNLLHEFTQLVGSIDDEVRGDEFDAVFRRRLDRLGKHVALLLAKAPPDQLQAFWDRIVVTEEAGGGTLTLVYPTGQRKTYPLVRINGRWIPRPLAESLLAIPAAQQAKVKEIQSLSQAALEGRIQGAGMARGFKDANYISLAEKFQQAAAAKTQEEFDAAIQQALVALQVGGFLGG